MEEMPPQRAAEEPVPASEMQAENVESGHDRAADKPVKRLNKDRPKGLSPSPKGGRPARFPGGSTTLRVPSAIAQPLQDVIDQLYPKLGDGRLDEERIARLMAFLNEMLQE